MNPPILLLVKKYDKDSTHSDLSRALLTKLSTLANTPMRRARNSLVGGQVKYYREKEELSDRLEILIGEIHAGNTSAAVKNEAIEILDELLKQKLITQEKHRVIYSRYLQ